MADDRTPQEQIADGYAKVACDVPYDRELEAMNDKQLDIEIERSKEGSARRSAFQREKEKRNLSMYAGGLTWVDREYDPHFMEMPPNEKFRRSKAVGRWLKEHVLAAVLIGSILAVLSTILIFYTNQWLGQHQEKIPPQSPPAQAMPV